DPGRRVAGPALHRVRLRRPRYRARDQPWPAFDARQGWLRERCGRGRCGPLETHSDERIDAAVGFLFELIDFLEPDSFVDADRAFVERGDSKRKRRGIEPALCERQRGFDESNSVPVTRSLGGHPYADLEPSFVGIFEANEPD